MSGQRTQTRSQAEVLIVGGGLVGLSAALLLRHHGVGATLVEKHATTSPQPKARRFHMRTMEIFRELGLAALVHDAARDLAGHDHFAAGRTLADSAQKPLWLPNGGDIPDLSPELPCLIAQDILEPVLRQAAVAAGVDVRFETELTGFRQTDEAVIAALSPRGAAPEEIRARHLIAADGARSGIRTTLGITRSGRGAVGQPGVNVYFTADLADVVRGREFNLCQIQHPDAPGWLASVDGRRRWVFMASGTETDRDWPRLLRTALGVPAPELRVLSVLAWQAEMLVADTYSAGRIHLAGDAAHVMPAYAAAGANTGIADAHNLAWKLAAVLRAEADPALLASYHAERRPAGWFAADQSARRSADPGRADPALAHPFVLAAGAFQYPAGALVPDGTVEPVTEFAPAGRVGTRIPHRWLDQARTRSTVDLAGPGWAVLSPSPATADFLAAGEHLLLRPDHVVAWRGSSPAEAHAVRAKLLAGSAL
ncbi:MAG TPA: FAD-dependent monooxygenase [Actinocrinis sp.]|nr:FAD-dependent monooxygenase [Actinocrinis sp.]